MRYVLKLEAIGDNYAARLRHLSKPGAARRYSRETFDWHAGKAYELGNKRLVPWVARLKGLDEHYGFVREFVRGQKDYTGATASGSRGIYFYYFLTPGFYEINERVTWKRAERYFARVLDETTLVRMTREEVVRCLR
jgi:hypothetical protein